MGGVIDLSLPPLFRGARVLLNWRRFRCIAVIDRSLQFATFHLGNAELPVKGHMLDEFARGFWEVQGHLDYS